MPYLLTPDQNTYITLQPPPPLTPPAEMVLTAISIYYVHKVELLKTYFFIYKILVERAKYQHKTKQPHS